MNTMENRFIETVGRVHHEQGENAFFGWFDGDDNADQALKNGFFDFAVTVLREPVPSFISKPYEKIALEIGYGGGDCYTLLRTCSKRSSASTFTTKARWSKKCLRTKGSTTSNFALEVARKYRLNRKA